MNKLTGRMVWNALLQNPDFADTSDSYKRVLRPYVLGFPDLLEDLMDQPVGIRNIAEAKIRFLKALIVGNYIRQTINRQEFGMHPAVEDTSMIMMTDRVREKIEEINRAATIQWAIRNIDHPELSEQLYLLGSKVSLAGRARKACEEGRLTIRELLRLQPEVLITKIFA